MNWQYIVFTFLAAFPAIMWVVGQVMEQKISKKGFAAGGDDYNPSAKDQFLTLVMGICSISTMIGLSVGAFGYPVFVAVGVVSGIIALVLMKKLGIFDTMLKG